MNMVKAVCECQKNSEEDLVVAVRRERFAFLEDWNTWIWILVILLTFLTGGMWLIGIAGFHFSDIMKPEYYCNQCGSIIYPKQFRL